MAGTPYGNRMNPEQTEEYKQELRDEIQAMTAAIVNNEPAKGDDHIVVTIGRVITRLAHLSCIALFEDKGISTPPSIFLGEIAGMNMEVELQTVAEMVRDHSEKN